MINTLWFFVNRYFYLNYADTCIRERKAEDTVTRNVFCSMESSSSKLQLAASAKRSCLRGGVWYLILKYKPLNIFSIDCWQKNIMYKYLPCSVGTCGISWTALNFHLTKLRHTIKVIRFCVSSITVQKRAAKSALIALKKLRLYYKNQL